MRIKLIACVSCPPCVMDDSLSGGGGVQTDFLKKYRNLFDTNNSHDYTIAGGGASSCDFESVGPSTSGVRSLESIPFPKKKEKKSKQA